MADQAAALDEALERVVTAARAHLAAVKAAGGAIDDEDVWRGYVELNNASFEYDQLLLDAYGEVTPWDTEAIDRVEGQLLTEPDLAVGETATDPYPAVVSVRQRRDYRVPSLAALLAAAEEAARRGGVDGQAVRPPSLGDAVLELIRDGDGSLGGLDLPELEPVAGVVTVTELGSRVELGAPTPGEGADPDEPFRTGPDDRLVASMYEQPYLDDEDEDEQ